MVYISTDQKLGVVRTEKAEVVTSESEDNDFKSEIVMRCTKLSGLGY